MKKLFIIALFVMSFFAFADEPSVPVEEIPSWLIGLIELASNLPYVGPVIVFIGKWSALISSVFTVVVVAVGALFKIPEIALRLAKLHDLADKLAAIYNKVIPYLKYFSMFNAQKKK